MSYLESRNKPRGWHPTENPCLDEVNKDSLHSIKHVAHYLETLHQPMILVGNAASWRMNDVWFDSHTVDILVSKPSIVAKLIYYLTTELRAWKIPDFIDKEAQKFVGSKHAFEVRRDADLLLQRREHTPRACIFLRIWTMRNYHMEINDETIMLMRGKTNIWEGSKPEESFRNPQMRLGNHFWVPTFKAYMDTLIYQSQERYIEQPYLSNDAGCLIGNLIKWNFLEKPPIRELVISQCSVGAQALWLRDYIDTYPRSEPVDRLDSFRKGNKQSWAVIAAKAEQRERFRLLDDPDLYAAFSRTTGDWQRVPADVVAVLHQRYRIYGLEQQHGAEFSQRLLYTIVRHARQLRNAAAHAALANDDDWAAKLMEDDDRSPVSDDDFSDDTDASDIEMRDESSFWGS
jgi:hypothetical protein